MDTPPPLEVAAQQCYIERQPIMDRTGNTFGYELYYHAGTTAADEPVDMLQASAAPLSYLLGNLEVSWLPEGKRVFINADLSLLLDPDFLSLLPEGRVVLDLQGNASDISEDMLIACDALKQRNIGIAIDWHGLAQHSPELTIRADFVKLNASENDAYSMHAPFTQLAVYPARKIATHIENSAAYKLCYHRGFDLFQGYFFTRPEMVAEKEVNTSLAQLVQLFDLVGNNAEIREIEDTLKRDPALVLKLLSYINSAGMSIGHKVTSIGHAIRMMGYKQLYRWVALLLYTSGNNAAPAALMKTVLTRSRFIELLGRKILPRYEQDNLFMVGMLSLLDVVFGLPLEKALAKLPVPETISRAVLQHEGIHGQLLRLAVSAEEGDTELLLALAAHLGLDLGDINQSQFEALGWAESLITN